jgi:predicted dehydrogenase
VRTLNWGILGAARIALNKVLPALQAGPSGTVVALASRDGAKAAAVARERGIPRAHGTYEALLADPGVDAVYIPLPNHLHVDWSIKALEAGKHVLCEKPLGLNAADALRLVEASQRYPHLKVMEAFMYRHHPQWAQAKAWIDEGAIGTLRTVQAFFSYTNLDPTNIRNRKDAGGGGLMDIGCYCIACARLLFGTEPVRVQGSVEYDPVFGTDRLASGLLDFPNGSATFTCSTQLAAFQRVNIVGTSARIEIEVPFNPPANQPARLWFQPHNEAAREHWVDACDQYALQADAFARAVLDDTPVPFPLEDAVANLRIIEALKAGSST